VARTGCDGSRHVIERSAMDAIDDGLWHVRGADFALPGGARLPLYSSIVRLVGDGLLLYAPASLDDATWQRIRALGEVAHVVAPNLFHHLFVADALARCPRATLHGPRSLAAKRPDLPAPRALDAGPSAWPADLETIPLAGAPSLDETVLFHRASGALLCGDLLFHVTEPANVATRLLLTLMGTSGGRVAQSRAWRFLARDRRALRRSLDRLLTFPVQRVLPCHGPACEIAPGTLAALVTRAYGGMPPRPVTTG
jgi:glyoxylase-like metal-dependent hydrolase (beta-lactamase superfamily II)